VLIVLGCCVPVLGIFAGFMLPALSKAQEAARRASCMNNVRQIGLAMIQYAGDHDDYFMPLVDAEGKIHPVVYEKDGEMQWDTAALREPARSGFAVLFKEGYLTTPKVFICPSSRDVMPGETFPTDFRAADLGKLILAEHNCSYGWDPTKRHSVDATCAIVADKPRETPGTEGSADNNSENHNDEGQNVFYNDGHVKWGTTPRPDAGDDPDIYTGAPGYEKSTTDAKIIR
jgi:type II secretory pathway pseudopilin PulG